MTPLLTPGQLVSAALAEPLSSAGAAHLSAWLAAGGPAKDLRPFLLAAIGHPQSHVRRRALLLAAHLRQEQPIYASTILTALSDPAWVVREAAATAAGLLDDEVYSSRQLLLELTLKDPRPQVRAAAAQAVAEQMEPEHDYGEAIRHPFERQRIRAADALGHTPRELAASAVRLLAIVLAESHVRVRRAALRGLSLLPAEAALPLLPLLVQKCFECDPTIAAGARRLCQQLLLHEAALPLRPLLPFLGANESGPLLALLSELPACHALKQAWQRLNEPAVPAGTSLPRRRLARLLACLCREAVAVR